MARIPRFLKGLVSFGSENRNTQLSVWYLLVVSLSNGVMLTGVVAIFIYMITGSSNRMVGYAEGFFGFCGLAPGLVGGYLSDKGRRDRVIRWSGYGTLVGVSALIWLLFMCLLDGSFDDQLLTGTKMGSYKFLAVCAGVSLLYSGESIGDSASQALLADSLSTGSRLQFMTTLQKYQSALYGTGPIVCLIIFAALGDKWSVTDLSIIIIVGLVIRLPCAVLCFYFNDDFTLPSDSKAVTEEESTGMSTKKHSLVPYYYFASDCLWCFGSGMTVKFFQIFFQDDLGMSPVAVMSVVAAQPFLVIPFTFLSTWLSLKIGRVQADILLWYCGISCLLAMAYIGSRGGFNSHIKNRTAVLGLWFMRAGFLQSTAAIQNSIIMDYVPKKERAKWAALGSITAAGWCGSAAVGGALINLHGYSFVFLTSSCFHVASTILRMPCLFLVPRVQQKISASPEFATKALLAANYETVSSDDAKLVYEFLNGTGSRLPNEDASDEDAPLIN
eukprot:TRINITY_DN12128_c1_g1_i1.p1 TRINITY_DN12128_c1_g1~~TRINITY_DN12128_c1_g1_i1.p1  ORF type:complete len:513 (+),score=137.94 TRINITY_DN12128_c1_g1_i1:40-1539(+)